MHARSMTIIIVIFKKLFQLEIKIFLQQLNFQLIPVVRVNTVCKQLLKSKWKDKWQQQLQNKSESCSNLQ